MARDLGDRRSSLNDSCGEIANRVCNSLVDRACEVSVVALFLDDY
jgi:hypothetical protein